MKFFAKLLAPLFAMALTACEDVPAPYEVFDGDNNEKPQATSIYYSSSNLYTGWSVVAVTPDQPWSQGSSYTQATGYQNWDGSGTKSNREVKGYLISPKFNTAAAETGKVKMSFNYTIRYTNNVSGWKNNHKVMVSKDFDGDADNFANATWQTLDVDLVESPYSDWTLYPSGDIQLPDEYVNVDGVYVAFYFEAPASSSTTWELMDFVITDGVAEGTGGDEPGGEDPDVPSIDVDLSKADLCIDASALGLANTATFESYEADGLTIKAEKGSGSNVPKYYTSGTAVRLYPGNFMNVASDKTIQKLVFTCVKGSVANNNVDAEPGTVSVSDPTVLIDGINAKEVTVTNTDTSTGAASNLRWQKIYVFYAQ